MTHQENTLSGDLYVSWDEYNKKIEELGGWCPRIVTMWNKHAPHKSMETSMKWQNMIKKL